MLEYKETKISELKPNPNNPRVNDEASERLVVGLEHYGFINPVVVNKRDNMILAGHTRIKALKKMGKDSVPVLFVDMDETTARGFSLWDNKSAEFAQWDEALLKCELESLSAAGFDELLTGFDFEDESPGGKDGLTDDDALPEVPEEPVCKLGDLWLLGDHRVLCGDSTDRVQVERLMDGQRADMVFTDPPYGMFLDADYSDMKSKFKGSDGGNKYDQVKGDNEDFSPELINTIFDNFGYCKEIFLWGADYYADILNGRNNGSWVVWDKRLDESADKMFGSTFELCWSKARHKRMLARVKWAGIFGMETQDTKKRCHPTQKPVELAEWFFDYWSVKGKNNIVDLYLGSGSTLIACQKTNRKCYGMELDPTYVQVILQRWADFTGEDPVREDGVKFSGLSKMKESV